ncbi:MAG TPA: ABC transporter substrate-binding protein [Nitrososphaerales archaeon]|nr:ABC transporter substrate-binding protein [Nitrososphaerales archaeon]
MREKTGPKTTGLVWAERIKPMSLNPGSVPILASDLGMFESAGVNLEVREYLGSPGAAAALESGEAVFAQVPSLEGVRLIAELGWPGKVFWVNGAEKTSSTSGFVMMSSPSIRKMGDLRGKRFGVGADGDYWAPIISNMLRLNGLRRDEVIWVKDLDPVQKADMLLDGRIDVMFTSIQNYIGKFEGDRRARVLAKGDELGKYREGMPQGPSFVGVASDRVLEEDRDNVLRVTRVLLAAARLFSDDRDAWVDAASRRRPDVPKEKIRKLWTFFQGDWPVNGGIDAARLGKVLEGLGSTRRPPIGRLLTSEFERKAIEDLGAYPT